LPNACMWQGGCNCITGRDRIAGLAVRPQLKRAGPRTKGRKLCINPSADGVMHSGILGNPESRCAGQLFSRGRWLAQPMLISLHSYRPIGTVALDQNLNSADRKTELFL
jgi:hypothetical protein